MSAFQTPLSNAQIELLDLFALQLPDETLGELKQLLLEFKFNLLDKLANEEWTAKEMTQQSVTDRLESHYRTTYTAQTRFRQQRPEGE
ncbi:hypothetical protein [Fibrella arboris]|uniref:hypothetical protein n=1 Tax=Fibrella arboris TaxID=3242486 RepID=UPI0035218455